MGTVNCNSFFIHHPHCQFIIRFLRTIFLRELNKSIYITKYIHISQWAKSPKNSLKECIFVTQNTVSYCEKHIPTDGDFSYWIMLIVMLKTNVIILYNIIKHNTVQFNHISYVKVNPVPSNHFASHSSKRLIVSSLKFSFQRPVTPLSIKSPGRSLFRSF